MSGSEPATSSVSALHAQRATHGRVALATSSALPHLDADGPLLIAALARAGLQGVPAVWDDAAVRWSSYDIVLVRSTWDYVHRRTEYLQWVHRCPRTANPADVLVWNTDKQYLQDLAVADVPVVPTAFIDVGQALDLPRTWSDGDVVVKPTVSAGAADTGRFPASSSAVHELVRQLHERGRAAMVQPYQAGVDAAGETALVFLGGSFSHAVRKDALLLGHGTRAPVVGDDAAPFLRPATASREQLDVAHAALAATPGGPEGLSYARVDLVPDAAGQPVVLELELTEPSLFLQHAPVDAVDRLAQQLVRLISSDERQHQARSHARVSPGSRRAYGRDQHDVATPCP